jgi:hypothetical protein
MSGTGGLGGGGSSASQNATVNTGGGGGGQLDNGGPGGNGGSGIVIVAYADNLANAVSTTGSPTFTQSGGYKFYKFTGSGTITF